MSALYVGFGPTRSLPLDLLLGSIPSLPRAALHLLAEQAIDRLDVLDGDADLEPDGDELDGTNAEDEGLYRGQYIGALGFGPGCPVSDPGEVEVSL